MSIYSMGYNGKLATGIKSSSDISPLINRKYPAEAIIAALSVHNIGLGY